MMIIHVTYKLEKGSPKELLEALYECGIVKGSREEKGNIKYDYYFPEKESDILYLVEVWESSQAFEEHLEMPHFKAANAVKDKFNADIKIEKYEGELI